VLPRWYVQPEKNDLEPELKFVWKGVKKFLE
jgi:hypothetical protein